MRPNGKERVRYSKVEWSVHTVHVILVMVRGADRVNMDEMKGHGGGKKPVEVEEEEIDFRLVVQPDVLAAQELEEWVTTGKLSVVLRTDTPVEAHLSHL